VKVKKSSIGTPQAWSVAELGALYTEHRFELKAHANRILKDSTRADEVVQDAFIKVMLAAPELSSSNHALSYLHRAVENICIDLFRAEGRRPYLVVLDEAQAEVEAQWQTAGDHSKEITAAEDAAIIRQALALLSPAERTALIMWEMDGRSTTEIATELGIKESAVRHTVSRARASLRRILSTLIIDEERGLTALDLLSTSYKKAAELARKSSRTALSLILVVTAFLGFHTMTGSKPKVLAAPSVSAPSDTELQIPLTTQKPVAPAKKTINKSVNRQEMIADLSNQLEFAKVQLSAQVDLLNVIMETKIFDSEAKSIDSTQIAALKNISTAGGTN
jgi:RNA polymerase sigma factor (sigma-70 family)